MFVRGDCIFLKAIPSAKSHVIMVAILAVVVISSGKMYLSSTCPSAVFIIFGLRRFRCTCNCLFKATVIFCGRIKVCGFML